MALLVTLTLVAGYLRIKLTEEIGSLFAGLIALVCLFISLFFVPFGVKLCLLAIAVTRKE